MACANTSLILFAAIGVLAVGFTAFSGLKERPQVREEKAPNTSHGGPVIA
jgi:hypothetical protein